MIDGFVPTLRAAALDSVYEWVSCMHFAIRGLPPSQYSPLLSCITNAIKALLPVGDAGVAAGNA